MNLKIFNEKECRVINTAAMKQMQLAAGNRIAMAQDAENPRDWYIYRNADGLEIKVKNGKQQSWGIQSSFLCNEILKSLGFEKGKTCGFKLAPAPTELDGKALWALITSKILKAG